jgi:hypothetical protein
VLSDDVLETYAQDLLVRDRTYHALAESGRLVPTQNQGLSAFHRTLQSAGVAELAAEQTRVAAGERRERNVALLEKLNPGRVFRIRMAVDDLFGQWKSNISAADARGMSAQRRLELVNLMLPTRLFVSELDAKTSSALASLVANAEDRDARADFSSLLAHVSGGIYPQRDGMLEFAEMTAIYPVGTWNQMTTHNGREIPQYPTPGRRALTTHQRTQTIDHVPDDQTYSWFPWLPYMHVGTRLHNAIHTLFWQMEPDKTSFLPPDWKGAKDPAGARYRHLWLLSRGPMSHGCTHLNAGHISELRQMLPARVEDLAGVDVYYNTSELYDVFDIDGDSRPEVMGVRYFIAYSLKDDRPDRLRARNERRAYYEWLYGGELELDESGRGRFSSVRDCSFEGRSAVAGRSYERIPLYEAAYEPERIQFYRTVDVDFARALRTVGVHQPAPDTRIGLAPTASQPATAVATNGR